ncbi:hypothetical protein SCLCIDRAFT_1224585 [Scleroderma citrinum Foug A]|uniref:Uncharacterized protein n=1 Tax=Scleroderma citrinum Foug A TaxID=1036808 RepID=A0A0C3D5H6_9AGAM|nr:hypothetical protein SCLCIDRAFT_1224585 [Scleroderma citrinum Foug A]
MESCGELLGWIYILGVVQSFTLFTVVPTEWQGTEKIEGLFKSVLLLPSNCSLYPRDFLTLAYPYQP